MNTTAPRLTRPVALSILALCAAAVMVGCSGGSASMPGLHAPVAGGTVEFNTETYDDLPENEFFLVEAEPLSTFSIDVDTASYSVVRRMLNSNQAPPAGAVRIEEMINYFPYDYRQPTGDDPFAVHLEVSDCPWTPEHRLVRIGLKGREFEQEARPRANLVFLIDVSGSMQSFDKLPLLVRSMEMLTSQLDREDRVAIVVYAGSSGLVLPSTTGADETTILKALRSLHAGGSTNGGEGIRLAYATAKQHFIEGGTNRVILATDGDFNVGVTSQSNLVDRVRAGAKDGISLTVLGFGRGNYKDSTMEKLADNGDGNYAYIDNLSEGRKVLVAQASGTLHTIARDVKIQVEFNPAKVAGHRLIGYENRVLAHRDFNDDKKDAGEIGAGHTVTALYEVVPVGVAVPTPKSEDLKYQAPRERTAASGSDELLTIRLRFKQPDGDISVLREFPLVDRGAGYADASPEFRFAASVACFGMVLRASKHSGAASLDTVLEMAGGSLGEDEGGHRHEFVSLVHKAKAVMAEAR